MNGFEVDRVCFRELKSLKMVLTGRAQGKVDIWVASALDIGGGVGTLRDSW